MISEIWPWALFIAFIVIMLILDLAVFHRKDRTITVREALLWSFVWISLALIFNVGIYFTLGFEPALNFFTGYLVEKSLSIDNLFVFLVVFTYFKVPSHLTHRVLFWGVLGAIIMRAVFIAFGISIISHFAYAMYIFGLFLIYTGIKFIFEESKEIEPEHNFIIKLLNKIVPITKFYEQNHFFVKKEGRWYATPLFVVLLVIETTDVIFAIDSIPAILAITTDPFIVFTSNIFAIMGLRTLYFAIVGLIELFHYLHYALAVIMMFIGTKMLIEDWYHIPIYAVLGVIISSLVIAMIASILNPKMPNLPEIENGYKLHKKKSDEDSNLPDKED